MNEQTRARKRRIPALVVSGFLGSGKTTTVRHLLKCAQAQGLKVAVISNEFGELGIDQALLGEGAQSYVELEGGCVCCKLGDELVETLELLRRDVDPDQVIVETSGVALPYDVMLNFWRDPVREWIEDETAVVVVNAEQVALQRDLAGTFEDQVCSADILLVNKVDLVDAEELASVRARLRELEPDAPIVDADFGQVDPRILFPEDVDGRRADRRNHPTHRPHTHEEFTSEVLEFPAPVDPDLVRERIQAVGAIRAKGFIGTLQGTIVVHGVGDRIEFEPARDRVRPDLVGRVVTIRRAARGES
jgi:cobalamin biosynthesis protein CobW